MKQSRPTFLLALALGLVAACSDSSSPGEETPPLAPSDVEGVYTLTLDLSTPSLDCQWSGVTMSMAPATTDSLHVLFGGGVGLCEGHGLGSSDTLVFAVQVPEARLRTNDRIRLVSNVGADTLSGTFSADRSAIAGSVVMRGTLATDGYEFTLRGDWTATRQDDSE